MTNAELSALPEPLQRVVREWPGPWVAKQYEGFPFLEASNANFTVTAWPRDERVSMNIYDVTDETVSAYCGEIPDAIKHTRAALRQLAADALALAGEDGA